LDSLTQFVLGAAVAEVLVGKKLGNKAIIWGGIAGTIPDLDVLLIPFIEPVQELSFHRGISHAFFYILLFVPIIAFFVHKFHKSKTEASFKDWALLFFGSIITHPILDAFTTYGTQLWLPFSRERVAISSIFVADLVFTLPILFGLMFAYFSNKTSNKRRFANNLGLGIACIYLAFTLGNKFYTTHHFRAGLAEQNIIYKKDRLVSTPTPLNNILWYSAAEAENGYYLSMYSIFDKNNPDDFIFVERNEHLLAEIENKSLVDEMKWFSKGYYVVQKGKADTLIFNDIRFGTLGWHKGKQNFAFKFKLFKENGKTKMRFVRGIEDIDLDFKHEFQLFWERLKGI